MAISTLNNGDTLGTQRTKINANFADLDTTKQELLTDPVTLVTAPATADADGTKGQMAIDGSYIYLCTATDTWVRASLVFATWV